MVVNALQNILMRRAETTTSTTFKRFALAYFVTPRVWQKPLRVGRLSPFAITFKFYILKIIDVNRVSIVRILITRYPINSMFSIIVIIIIKRHNTHFLNILRNGRGCYLSNREEKSRRKDTSRITSSRIIFCEKRWFFRHTRSTTLGLPIETNVGHPPSLDPRQWKTRERLIFSPLYARVCVRRQNLKRPLTSP